MLDQGIRVGVTVFISQIDIRYGNTLEDCLSNLDEFHYQPNGSAALLDGIELCINRVDQLLENEGDTAIIAILTDGY